MGKKLQSMDVVIHGTTRTFEYDPPVKVESDDEGEASLELLEDAETTEVVLADDGPAMAEVEYTVRVTVEVNFTKELEDLGDEDFGDVYDIESYAEDLDIEDEVRDALLLGNYTTEDIEVQDVSILGVYDEDGDEFEF